MATAVTSVTVAAAIPAVISIIFLVYKKYKNHITTKQFVEGALIDVALVAIGVSINVAVTALASTGVGLLVAFAITALVTVFFIIVEKNREDKEETNTDILWRMVSKLFGYHQENNITDAP
jgi:uncharacterized membrane protein YgaE (UPF0421/DUF939 family)